MRPVAAFLTLIAWLILTPITWLEEQIRFEKYKRKKAREKNGNGKT